MRQFKPAWWLSNRHLQTLWCVIAKRRLHAHITKERIELPDSDFIDVAWLGRERAEQPLIIILHGLGGSVDSHYVRGLLTAVDKLNWRAVVMHFRGASGEPNRLARGYHSGDTQDFDFLVKRLREEEPNVPLAAVGYSLGGNVLLKWLGESPSSFELRAAVAVSVPFDLSIAADTMTRGFAKLYQWYLLNRLKRQLRQKFTHQVPEADLPVALPDLAQLKSFWAFDNAITAPLHGFRDVNDYYTKASSCHHLQHITVPTLIIHAKDDPFMTPHAIPLPEALAPSVNIEITEAGGHVGFISGQIPGKPVYWLEERIKHFLQAIMPHTENTSRAANL